MSGGDEKRRLGRRHERKTSDQRVQCCQISTAEAVERFSGVKTSLWGGHDS